MKVLELHAVAFVRAACAVLLLLGGAERAAAQGVDFTFFIGRAFPIYDERLTLRPSTPTVPGVDITVDGTPLLEADGGAVVGGALAFEWGVLGIEGRLDGTDVAAGTSWTKCCPALRLSASTRSSSTRRLA